MSMNHSLKGYYERFVGDDVAAFSFDDLTAVDTTEGDEKGTDSGSPYTGIDPSFPLTNVEGDHTPVVRDGTPLPLSSAFDPFTFINDCDSAALGEDTFTDVLNMPDSPSVITDVCNGDTTSHSNSNHNTKFDPNSNLHCFEPPPTSPDLVDNSNPILIASNTIDSSPANLPVNQSGNLDLIFTDLLRDMTNSANATISNLAAPNNAFQFNAVASSSSLPAIPAPASSLPIRMNFPQISSVPSTEPVTVLRTPSLGFFAIPARLMGLLTKSTKQHTPPFDWVENTKRLRLQLREQMVGRSSSHSISNATPPDGVSPSNPGKRRHQTPDLEEGSSKRRRIEQTESPSRENNQFAHVPGLYRQMGKKRWICCFKENGDLPCNLVIEDRRRLRRHIGVHAKREEMAIQQGKLSLDKAVAIPKREMMEYTCLKPNCG